MQTFSLFLSPRSASFRPFVYRSLAATAVVLLAGVAPAQTALHSPARLALLESPSLALSTAAFNAPAPDDLSSSSAESASVLPDEPQQQQSPAPSSHSGFSPLGKATAVTGTRTPAPTDITIAPHTVAPHQTAKDKLLGSAYDAISPFTLFGELISASYSQLTDGSPNYNEGGSTGVQFGQRFGAAVARGTSQNLFSEGVLAAALHEDPRYYQLGVGNSFFKRLFYAGTRPLVTRTDGGRQTPNLALLGGYLGAAELTPVYYPPLNQTQTEVMKTWGSSLGGAALGYVVTEFLPDVLQDLHLTKFSHF